MTRNSAWLPAVCYVQCKSNLVVTCNVPLSMQRANADCVLGSAVTIERRNPQTCCLNGRDYDREIHIDICVCTVNDYEW